MKNKIHCFINHIYPRKLYVVITDSALYLNQNFENRECHEQYYKKILIIIKL